LQEGRRKAAFFVARRRRLGARADAMFAQARTRRRRRPVSAAGPPYERVQSFVRARRSRIASTLDSKDSDMHARRAALAAGLLALAAQASAQSGKATYEMDAAGEVQIAPDGAVSDYRLDKNSALPPAIAQLVDRNVRAWHFEPVLVDGKPVVAKTALHMQLKAEPLDGADRYTVRVQEIRFGAPVRSAQNKPPHYPEAAVGVRLGAKVVLAMRLDAAGNVTDVEPYQTSLDARARSEAEAERWRRLFEKASIAAAKTWHYDLTETVNGRAIGTKVMAPVVYSVSNSYSKVADEGRWKAYVAGPIRAVSWMPADSSTRTEQNVAALGDGQDLSLDSRFHLKDDVVGKAL
jgi:hypothetical protein